MIRKELIFFVLAIAIQFLTGCEKNETDPQTEHLIFPIGRSSFQSNTYSVTINGSAYSPKVLTDSHDGYWLEFSRADLELFQTVQIQFTREKQDLNLFHEQSRNTSRWVSSSYYIDSDNELIKAKAAELTRDAASNVEKAKRIQRFVIGHLKLNFDVRYSFYHKASTTLEYKEGNCMNYSRLLVALCRAANIPSRTIWGVVYGYGPSTQLNYNFHHQWAEILDDDNNWRVLDLTMTQSFDLNNIQYLDLIYGAEENDMVRDNHLKEIMIPIKNRNGYPVVSSDLDFNLVSNNQPISLTTEYIYEHNGLHFYE